MKKTYILQIFIISAMFCSSAMAAPEADLWKRWSVRNSDSERKIDHGTWDRFLKKYVVEGGQGVNLVRYEDVAENDRRSLKNYIKSLENSRVDDLNENEQLAFWVNLYNGLTVKVILEHYPVDSILDIDISPGLFSNGPWGKKLVAVEGERISLDDIEHRILRPIWKDPRIHYAVNCASIGCPNLQKDAFTGENADALLDKAAVEYVNHGRGARVENGKLEVSSIYEWFKDDFGGNDKNVIEHLKKWAKPPLFEKLEKIDEISDDHYDWSLNESD